VCVRTCVYVCVCVCAYICIYVCAYGARRHDVISVVSPRVCVYVCVCLRGCLWDATMMSAWLGFVGICRF